MLRNAALRALRQPATRVPGAARALSSESRGIADARLAGLSEAEQAKRRELLTSRRIRLLCLRGCRELDGEEFGEAARVVPDLTDEVMKRNASAIVMNSHGNTCLALGRPEEAQLLLKGAFDHGLDHVHDGLGDDQHREIASYANDLAVSHLQMGELDKAQKLLGRALYWINGTRAKQDVQMTTALSCNMGLVLGLRAGESTERALLHHEHALDQAEGIEDDDPITTVAAGVCVTQSLCRMGSWQQAERTGNMALGKARALLERANEAHAERPNRFMVVQAELMLSAALLALARVHMELACSAEDIAVALALAEEALTLRCVDPVPALTMIGLAAPTPARAVAAYESAIAAAQDDVVRKALEHNLAQVQGAAAAAEAREEGGPSAARSEAAVAAETPALDDDLGSLPHNEAELAARGMEAFSVSNDPGCIANVYVKAPLPCLHGVEMREWNSYVIKLHAAGFDDELHGLPGGEAFEFPSDFDGSSNEASG